MMFGMFMKEFGIQEGGVEYQERTGAYGVVFKGDFVFIEKARLGYFLPGGGLEKGETPEAALEREFLEETGCEITNASFLGKTQEHIMLDERYARKIGYFYSVDLGEKTAPSYPDGHKYPVEWVHVDTIKEFMPLESQWWAIEELYRLKRTEATNVR